MEKPKANSNPRKYIARRRRKAAKSELLDDHALLSSIDQGMQRVRDRLNATESELLELREILQDQDPHNSSEAV